MDGFERESFRSQQLFEEFGEGNIVIDDEYRRVREFHWSLPDCNKIEGARVYPRKMSGSSLSLALLFALSGAIGAPSPVRFALAGTDGRQHHSAEFEQVRATVLVFLGTDCPISNRYSPVLHRLEVEYRPRGVAFRAIFSDPAVDATGARKHLADYGLEMPGLMDPAATLARQTGARVTPETVIISPQGTVLYRGRIDDKYLEWGKSRTVVTRQDLRLALDAVLAGKPVEHPVTKALGCAIPGIAS